MNEAMKDFTYNPTSIDIPRSKIKMKHSHKTTFNTGQIIPIYWREVLPGSTVKMEMAEVTRMQTPIFPIMDNAFIDTMFFFVPNRILWNHWEEFMGENKSGYWEQTVDYQVPQIKFYSNNTMNTSGAPSWIKGTNWYPYGIQAGCLADYLGLPIVDANTTTPTWRNEFEVNALPFRAYYQIYNDWFRDENFMNPMEFDKGDADLTAHMGSTDQEEIWPVVPPAMAAKFHDYFTSALPEPQKGDPVTVGLLGQAPILFTAPDNDYSAGTPFDPAFEGLKVAGYVTANGMRPYADVSTHDLYPNKSMGMVADMSSFGGISINTLRQSFAVQRYLEKLARGGSRYIELLHSMFGVTSPDGRLQRAEYLGGRRQAVNIDQVVQTSSTDLTSPQGNVAGYSMTSQSEDLFTKSFVEHGILMGVQVIRIEHSYQDGVNKMWLRKSEYDYYNPTFAHLGEMPIYNMEIYAGTNKDKEAFGYQEAWAEYRYMNNHVSGEFRSKYHQTLDAWHFADNYSALPGLNFAWMTEYDTYIDRNIAVSHKLADQWMNDIFFQETWTQPMPVYSVPGLIDHY